MIRVSKGLFLVASGLALVAACGAGQGAPFVPGTATNAADASAGTPPASTVALGNAPDAAAGSSDDASASSTSVEDAAPDAPPELTTACTEQPPQDFLIRKSFYPKYGVPKDEADERAAAHKRAIEYRTEHYGYFPGFGSPSMNPHPPAFYARRTKMFGLDVTVHKRIMAVLPCVEQEIAHACADHPYTPKALGGIRMNNTYHTGEITNHAYAIAIDIDPALNSCCGCVPPWNSNPLCHKPAASEYDRMAMPECWVHAFEKYGFYWLGHDVLMDTMHFEFLGDPDRILRDGSNANWDAVPDAGHD
jgi:hypothetical protein